MFYEGYRKTYDYTREKMILAFEGDIKIGEITINKAND